MTHTDLPPANNISLWLIFDQTATDRCKSIISIMAQLYDSEEFEPHITLSGTPDWPVQKLESSILELSQNISPFKLKTLSVQCSSNPYQKLTQAVQKQEELSLIHQLTDNYFDGSFAKRDYPHISYLYSNIECTYVSAEISNIESSAPQTVQVTGLKLVKCKGTPEDWKTLSKWEL